METQGVKLEVISKNSILVCCGGKCPLLERKDGFLTIKDDENGSVRISDKYIYGIIEALELLRQ